MQAAALSVSVTLHKGALGGSRVAISRSLEAVTLRNGLLHLSSSCMLGSLIQACPPEPNVLDSPTLNIGSFVWCAAGNIRSSAASALPADPFAFNMGAFDLGISSAPADWTPANQQPASADPYAFDMGSFGGDPAPAGGPPPQQAPPSADPFAFDVGAFGMGGDSQQEAGRQAESQPGPPPASSGDPFAFDPGAFGMGDAAGSKHEEQPDTAGPVPGAAVDPFAFNPEAFGMGAPSQPAPSSAPGPAVDPFAFDPEAFGMGQSGQPPQRPPSSACAGHSGDPSDSDASMSGMGAPRQGAGSVPGSRTTGTSLPGAARSTARDRSQGRQGTMQQAAAVFQPRRPGSKPADALSLEELEALERLLLPQVDPGSDEGKPQWELHRMAIWQLRVSHIDEGSFESHVHLQAACPASVCTCCSQRPGSTAQLTLP